MLKAKPKYLALMQDALKKTHDKQGLMLNDIRSVKPSCYS